MAQEIALRHPATGLTKKGYIGFSWTTLLFSTWPALFRADYMTFVCASFILWWLSIIAGSLAVFGGVASTMATNSGGLGLTIILLGWLVPAVVWAAKYNGYYTRKMIEKGYRFADTPERIAAAQQKLGISAPLPQAVAAE